MRPVSVNGAQIPVFGLGTAQNLAFTGTSAACVAFGARTRAVVLVPDTACRIEVGAAPTAVAASGAAGSALLPALIDRTIRVNIDQQPLLAVVDVSSNVFTFFKGDFDLNRRGPKLAPATGQTVRFYVRNGGTLPAPLTEGTPYYVRSDGTLSSSISNITPGSAVDITDAGTDFFALFCDRLAAIQNASGGNLSIVELL